VKRADLRTREVTTLVGTGDAGRRDGDARRAGLNEPNDVAFLDGRFYIADTNNHVIRVFDPRTERLSTMSLGPVPLERAEKAVVAEKAIEAEKPIVLTERSIPSKAKGIYFQLMLPKGYHWNELAEQQIKLSSENPEIVSVSDPTKEMVLATIFPGGQGKGRATWAQIVGYYCDRGDSCCFRPAEFELPLRIEETAPLEEITAVYQLSP
jgi:hypothetical protein